MHQDQDQLIRKVLAPMAVYIITYSYGSMCYKHMSQGIVLYSCSASRAI
jgi:hypothetical protein